MVSLGEMTSRKGAPRIADIPAEVLQALNQGHLETVNLVEFLAIDLQLLAPQVADDLGLDPRHERLGDTLAMLDAIKPMKRHGQLARALYDLAAQHPDRDRVATQLAQHSSDVARCWAAHWVQFSGLPLPDKLHSVRRFAADPHFGVREMAWSAVRDDVVASLEEALVLLQPWVLEEDERIRRFATEATRPRGVWCAQIEVLKREPWRAQALLEPVKSDPSRYVQNSVANWLNDASKSQPAWVEETCARWSRESATPATRYIVSRALRTLAKS